MRGDGRTPALARAVSEGRLECLACQRRCVLSEGQRGYCNTRENRSGELVSLTYGRVAALHWAEVERKPLFHFYPGRVMLSVGSVGCNFRCPGCQNWQLAHADIDHEISQTQFIPPGRLVGLAVDRHALGISWTYNEPAIWFEYTLDGARLAKDASLKTNTVTNGSLTTEALDRIGPFLDAYRVDLKGFSERTYRRIANFPNFEGILEVARRAKHHWGMHVECVTNVIPTLNDNEDELRRLAAWIVESLGSEVPWHVTRFVPHHRLSHLRSTPVEVLEKTRQIGLDAGLDFVYIGNVPGHPAENTRCPGCGEVVIERAALSTPRVLLDGNACPSCGTVIPGEFG